MKRIMRSRRAVTVIEMVVGLLILIPVLLLVVDVTILNIAVQINDSAAREADRLAAAGAPSEANARAARAVERINSGTAGYITKIVLKSVTFAPGDLLAREAALKPYGGNLSGNVTVATTVTVQPMLLRYVYPGPYDFVGQQSCPITYMVPNTAGGQAINP